MKTKSDPSSKYSSPTRSAGYRFRKKECLNIFNPCYSSLVIKATPCKLQYSSFLQNNTSPEIYGNKFFEFCDHYKDFSQLYTDGSMMGNQVSAAVVHGSVTKTTRLPNKSSI